MFLDGGLGWGSSVHKQLAKSKKTLITKSMDISELIDQYTMDDYIVVKVDLEGTEYPLFEHFLRKGTINKIDYIAMEFHDIPSNNDRIQFFKRYLQTVNKNYSQWYLGHDLILPSSVF